MFDPNMSPERKAAIEELLAETMRGTFRMLILTLGLGLAVQLDVAKAGELVHESIVGIWVIAGLLNCGYSVYQGYQISNREFDD